MTNRKNSKTAQQTTAQQTANTTAQQTEQAKTAEQAAKATAPTMAARLTCDCIRVGCKDGKATVKTQSVTLPSVVTMATAPGFAAQVCAGVLHNTKAKAESRKAAALAGKARESLKTYPDAAKVARFDVQIDEAETVIEECCRQATEAGLAEITEIDALAALVAAWVTGDAYPVDTAAIRTAVIGAADALEALVKAHDKATAEDRKKAVETASQTFGTALTPVRQAIKAALAGACACTEWHKGFKLSISAPDILAFIMQDGGGRLTRAEILHTMQDKANKCLEKALPVYLLAKMKADKGIVG